MTRTWRLTTTGWALVLVTGYRLATLLATLRYDGSITQLHVRNTATSVFGWWDGGWYLRIAQQGYDAHFVQSSGLGQQNAAAFPPALGALMAGTHRAFGVDYTVAGLVWGFLALLALGVGLVRLVELDYGRRIALLSLGFLLLWPPAMFFGMLYQDGITLAGIVWAFLFVRKQRPLLAGLALGVASLGKLVAVVALAALVLDQLRESDRARRVRDLALLVVPPVATVCGWILYVGLRYHHLTEALDVERQWGHALSTPWHSISVSLDVIRAQPTVGYRIVLIGDLVAIGLMLLATVYLAIRRVRPSYVVYSATMLLALTCNGNAISVDRYLLMAFPVFLAAALAADRIYERRRAVGLAAGCVAVGAAVPAQLWLIGRFAGFYWAG